MGNFFTVGETKIRPGVYQRYENAGGAETTGAMNGVCACAVKSRWGKLGAVLAFESAEAAAEGIGADVTDVAELFRGGASLVKVVRVGTGGTKAAATLKDTTSGSALDAVTVTAKYEGDRTFTYTMRTVLGDPSAKELLIYEGASVLERYSFTAGGDESARLVEAAKSSALFDIVKKPGYAGVGTLALVANGAFSAGANPTVTNQDYSNAFLLLEPERWNTICVDTDETAVHALLAAYMARVYSEGKMGFAVVGEPQSVAIATRQANASAFNDCKVIYVGGGWIYSDGTRAEGHRAAARIAAMVASIPSSDSITRKPIASAVAPIEVLTGTQQEACIRAGMLTVSTSAAGVVWVEAGITTLVNPTGEDDAGWKKIKRTKIRFELMQRVNDAVEPLIGRVPNNTDGRTTVVKAVQGVVNTMVSESKLQPGAKAELDSANAPVGDSAWFIITADDVDSLEKIYFVYRFRFAQIV